MTLTSAMQSAISGLTNAQIATDVISNNIVNSSTLGYTRKIHTQTTAASAGYTAGVLSGFSKRVVDNDLLSQLNKESSNLGYLASKSSFLGKVEDLFGTPESNTTLPHAMTDVSSAFEDLALDVTNTINKSTSVSNLSSLITKINDMTKYIQGLRVEADQSIATGVSEINDILNNIADLNDEIVKANSLGTYSADDFLDQRDAAFQRLSEIIDVQSYTRSTGELIINTSSGESLLNGTPKEVSHSAVSSLSSWNTYTGGDITGIYVNGVDITNQIKGGEIGGLIETRDTTLPNLQAEVNEMMDVLAKNLNAINSQGVAYPAIQGSYTSDKTFFNLDGSLSSTQSPSISISNGDVKLIVYGEDGKEIASTSLVEGLGFSSGAIYSEGTHPDNSTLLGAIESWLTTDPTGPRLVGASASINSDGSITIDTGSSSVGLAFRDETSSIVGSKPSDVTVQFDLDGDGVYDTENKGFVNSFGFNNIVSSTNDTWLYDSDVVPRGKVISVSSTNLPVLSFSTENNLSFGSIEIKPGDTIDSIASRINSDPTLNSTIKAEVVKEGAGYRLRIESSDGSEILITEPTTTSPIESNVMEQLGLSPSTSSTGGMYKISDSISNSYDLISTGQVQYDSTSGEYFLSSSDNTIANKFAEVFSSDVSFDESGEMASGDFSLIGYATNIITQVASYNTITDANVTYQTNLVTTISSKISEVSGVNLDEELASLTMIEQSYNAAAQIITAINEMMDELFNIA